MRGLTNISVKKYRSVLSKLGLHKVRTKGGHEAWFKEVMSRPVIFQTHINPIPEFIIRNNIRNMKISNEDFLNALKQ